MPSLRQSLTILHGNLSDFKTGILCPATAIYRNHACMQYIEVLNVNIHVFVLCKPGDMLRKLLILESKYGPLPGYQPALAEVEDYLNEVI